MIIGSHCGMSGNEMMLGSVKEALSYGANALMIYTGAPQNTIRKNVYELKIPEAKVLMRDNGIEHLIIHAPYIINPATADLDKRNFCINFLAEEIRRSYQMGAKVIVLHPGNSLTLTLDEAISNIAYVLNQVIEKTDGLDVVIALETMAGKGSEVGRSIEELKRIYDLVIDKSRIGICLDTCHLHDAGYDLVHKYAEVKEEIKKSFSFKQIKAIHVNDSKNELGAHKDRHANIGQGFIGFETLKMICTDEDFALVPKILETPYIDKLPPYKDEIARLKG